MKTLMTCLFFFAGVIFSGIAGAYNLDCDEAGTSCKVSCDNGQYAGTMYWNGSQWSDGLRSSTDKNQVAKQIVKAQGTNCK